jgi:glycine/D-amino acid oxidase-like deaminating enzyme
MAPNSTVYERLAPDAEAIDAALAGSRRSVFWLDGRVRPEHPALAGSERTDLVIVGGGYTGLWSAVRAKERDPGRRVTVLEASRIGWAASGRNGGFCEASITHGEPNGRQRWPDEYPVLERLGRENLDQIEATVVRYGMDVEFERTGTLSIAVEPHQVEWLADDDGFLDQDAARAELHSPIVLAASWDRDDTALVHPAKLALELARIAVKLGVVIHERSRVRGIERGDGGWVRVVTDGGSVTADRAVLATNAFPSLLARDRLMTVPVYDYVLMTEPLSAEQLASVGWARRQGVADLANQFHYLRRTADDRILFGGYDAVYHAGGKVRPAYEDRPETFRRLASHFITMFPQLQGVRFSHRWAGVIDTSTQFCAFFGTAFGGRVATAAGFTGLGVGASRFAADVALDLADGLATERTELRMVRQRPLPFPPEPAASIGVAATKWAMDRADHNGGRRNLMLRTLDAVGLGFDS